MFLSQLKEENKELFLKLCVHAAMANDEFADEERNTIQLYCTEMELPMHIPEINADLDELLAVINKFANETEKKIIVVEILGLLKSDDKFDEKEHVFFDKVKESLSLSDEFCDKTESLLDKYTSIYKEPVNLIY